MPKKRRDAAAPSDYVKTVAAAILRVMREHGELPIADLVRRVSSTCEASTPSVRKACTWLCKEHDAPLRYDGRSRAWVLDRRDYSLPLLDPTADDIVAVAFAGALVSPLGDRALDQRIQSLLMELDERASAMGAGDKLRSHAVMATSSAVTPVDPRVLSTLARAVGRDVVRFTYTSPWRDEPTLKSHVVEPWQLRVHDGNLYLRAWLRSRGVPSTFRVSQIHTIALTSDAPSRPRPPAHEIWGEHGPGHGVDVDDPDTAVVRIRGPIARLVAATRWHEEQHDRWVKKDEVLERTFRYESQRETARRLLGMGDALEHVEPPALREELASHVRALARVVEPPPDPL
jgi:predicted DNA-binding transcriptional regulator YafY